MAGLTHSSQLRITRSDAGARLTTLHLEGRLAEAEWPALRSAREACGDRPLALELSGLRYLDPDIARLLTEWRRDGVGLCGGSGFIRELLRLEEQSTRDARPSPAAGNQGGSR